MKIKTIKIPIYTSILRVIIGTPEEATKEISKFKTLGDWSDLSVLGKFIPAPNGEGFIYMHKYDTAVLIHEILHFTTHLLNNRGIEISYKNDEVMAYMIEYIYSEYKKR